MNFKPGDFKYTNLGSVVTNPFPCPHIKIMVMFQRITCGYVTTFIPNLSDWACKFDSNCHYSSYCTLPSRKKGICAKKCLFGAFYILMWKTHIKLAVNQKKIVSKGLKLFFLQYLRTFLIVGCANKVGCWEVRTCKCWHSHLHVWDWN